MIFARLRKENPKVKERQGRIEARRKGLKEKADTLDAVIALEKRLSEIRYDLESMESQLRLYDNQVEYSILRLICQK